VAEEEKPGEFGGDIIETSPVLVEEEGF